MLFVRGRVIIPLVLVCSILLALLTACSTSVGNNLSTGATSKATPTATLIPAPPTATSLPISPTATPTLTPPTTTPTPQVPMLGGLKAPYDAKFGTGVYSSDELVWE